MTRQQQGGEQDDAQRPQVVDEVCLQHGAWRKLVEQQQVIESSRAVMVTSQVRGWRATGARMAGVPAPQNSSTSPTSTSGETLVIREVSAAREAHNKMVKAGQNRWTCPTRKTQASNTPLQDE